jgi:hypothetical protein
LKTLLRDTTCCASHFFSLQPIFFFNSVQKVNYLPGNHGAVYSIGEMEIECGKKSWGEEIVFDGFWGPNRIPVAVKRLHMLTLDNTEKEEEALIKLKQQLKLIQTLTKFITPKTTKTSGNNSR